jgi:hypothetical protein
MTVNVNVIVVCGFADCDWSMEIDRSPGADPMAAHAAYLDHLDDHDPDDDQAEHDTEVARALAEDRLPGPNGLYAGDTAEQIATDQARVDRFMSGGEDR